MVLRHTPDSERQKRHFRVPITKRTWRNLQNGLENAETNQGSDGQQGHETSF
jgi:hypothetical protein